MKHNASTYTNHRCRCEVCRQAWSAYIARRKAERYALVAEHGLPIDVEHGASAYGNWGCRCPACRKAWAAKERPRARRRRNVTT